MFYAGLRGGSGPSNAVMYTAAYDQVDIDITYRPLHTPGAPPPYSSSFDSAPPAYSTINKGGSGDTPTGIHTCKFCLTDQHDNMRYEILPVFSLSPGCSCCHVSIMCLYISL